MGLLYDIPELKDCSIMQEKDIGSFADCFADGFEGYSLMEYFCGGEYDEEKIRLMWDTSIRAFNGQLLGVYDNEHINAAVLLAPPGSKNPDLMSYLKAGGFRLVRSFGLKRTVRMQSFDAFAGRIKKKYMTNNCWYLFGFVSRKEVRGQGYGSKVLSPILAYFDRTGQDCYLETLEEKNVALYKHFGFELMESVKLPHSDLTIYAMLRKKMQKEQITTDQLGSFAKKGGRNDTFSPESSTYEKSCGKAEPHSMPTEVKMNDNAFIKKFSEDEIIIYEGKIYDEMYKIVSGRAALYLQYGTENEYLIGVLSDGKCFGEVSVLTGKPSPYTVVAVSDTMVMRIGSDKFESFIAQNPRNVADIMKNMANSIIMLKANVGLMSEEMSEIIKSLETDKPGKELADSIRQKLTQYNSPLPAEGSIFSEKA